MSDSDVKVVSTGQADSVAAAMAQAGTAVRESVTQMQESLKTVSESFETFQGAAAALGALFAGGVFKEMVTATNELAESAIALGISLGITTTQASIYNVA